MGEVRGYNDQNLQNSLLLSSDMSSTCGLLSALLVKRREEKNIVNKNGPSIYHDDMVHLK